MEAVVGVILVKRVDIHIKTRISEHERDLKKMNLLLPTALVEHSRDFNHHFEFDKTKVLACKSILFKRLEEMIYIKKKQIVSILERI